MNNDLTLAAGGYERVLDNSLNIICSIRRRPLYGRKQGLQANATNADRDPIKNVEIDSV
ncbi:MAG: hypothetical protein ABI481_09180 [Pyrinomonadaceae bacterium]